MEIEFRSTNDRNYNGEDMLVCIVNWDINIDEPIKIRWYNKVWLYYIGYYIASN